MGKNKYQIINADCITAMKKMENEAVDLILTDPPYNLGKFMKDRATNLKQMRSNFLVLLAGMTWNFLNGKHLWTSFLKKPLV